MGFHLFLKNFKWSVDKKVTKGRVSENCMLISFLKPGTCSRGGIIVCITNKKRSSVGVS